MKSILCYGDSNTWGYDPAARSRYEPSVRWPMVLQRLLGDSFRVIEEGLNGRTTVWEDPVEGDKSGIRFLPTCLDSHSPLDLVVLMLGSNDLKRRFSVDAFDAAQGLRRLARLVGEHEYLPAGKVPRICIVSPPRIGRLSGEMLDMFGPDAEAKSAEFPRFYSRVARDLGCLFFDAAAVVEPGDHDSLHLSEAGHGKLARALAEFILTEESNP
jgi:lysophospholipase L1-like esterase